MPVRARCSGSPIHLKTPSHGPRIRLRALFLDAKIHPTEPKVFDPCVDCKVYCKKVCPENAMDKKIPTFKLFDFSEHLPGRDGTYNRELCSVRMEKDIIESSQNTYSEQPKIKYCRKCEFVCPVGKKAGRY